MTHIFDIASKHLVQGTRLAYVVYHGYLTIDVLETRCTTHYQYFGTTDNKSLLFLGNSVNGLEASLNLVDM